MVLSVDRVKSSRLAASGAMWSLLGYGGSQLIRLSSNLLLAWLLFPAAFGLMGLINIVMQGLEMFSDLGIGPSIIRDSRGEDASFLNTAWTIQVLKGFLLWLVACAITVPFADFYTSTDPLANSLVDLLPVAAFVSVISGFNSTGIFLLNRQLNFKLMAALEIVPQAASAVVMVGLAQFSYGVWALVFGTIIGSLTKLTLSHVWNPGPPNRFAIHRESFYALFNFGKWIFLSTMVVFLANNLDRLMLGKFLSLSQLGIYSLALTFARLGIHISSRLSSTVIFPLLSRIQNNPQQLVEACLRSRNSVLWISGLGCAAFALLAPLFFGQLYDTRYAGAGEVAQWLALYVWTHVLDISIGGAVLALGYTKQMFMSNVVRVAALSLAVVGYTVFGLPGFISMMAASNFIAHLYLVKCLPFERVKFLTQDLLFSAGLMISILPVIIYFHQSKMISAPFLYIMICSIVIIPLFAVGAYKVRLSLGSEKSLASKKSKLVDK